MTTRLKHLLVVLLLATLSGGVLGCEPGYHHGWYGDPYYGSGWGRSTYSPWDTYGPYAYRGDREWRHHYRDHDD